MALVWSESCQWTTNAGRFERSYTFSSLATLLPTSGRNGGQAAGSGALIAYPPEPAPSGDTFIAFVRVNAAVGQTFWLAFGAAISNVTNSFIRAEVLLEIASDGSIKLYRCTNTSTKTELATTVPGFLSMTNVLYGIAIRVKIHGSTGETEVLVDGVSVPALALTGANTLNNGTWNSVSIRSNGGTGGWCDFVVLDNTNPTGNDPNTILPDVRVDYRVPTGAGYLTQFTPDSGNNWARAGEAAVDDDTSYVQATAAAIDGYEVQDLPLPGATIIGVKAKATFRKTDAGVAITRVGLRSSGVNYMTASIAMPVSYITRGRHYGTNPAGGAWTEAAFNAAQVVIEKV